jgi:hypothetical protein
MFPGFVNIYRDDDSYVHLYFFKGITDRGDHYYKDIDLSNIPFAYTCVESVSSVDYKFDNKSIIRIKCNLVPTDSSYQTEKKILTIK